MRSPLSRIANDLPAPDNLGDFFAARTWSCDMHPVLARNQYFVKEHAGIFKASSNYDVFDPQTNQQLLQCREERLGIITKLFRFTDYKRMTPFEVIIRTPDGQPVV